MKVLVAEDEEISRRCLGAVLTKWGYEVVIATNGEQAWELLQQENAPQLAILDWMMPGLDGIELCKKIRRSKAADYIYIIMLTGNHGMEHVIAGMEAGADDYVRKPFDSQELRVRLRAGQRIMEMKETLRIQATRDALTGAWNRGAVLQLLQRDLSRADRDGTSVGVILIDVDHFKRVNDTYGHVIGDTVLQEVVTRMNRVLRPSDALGRYGGEEFLVILPECQSTDVLKVAERLRQCVSASTVITPAGSIPVTISLGATATAGANSQAVTSLLQVADAALYQAKREGRNGVVLLMNQMAANSEGPASLESQVKCFVRII